MCAQRKRESVGRAMWERSWIIQASSPVSSIMSFVCIMFCICRPVALEKHLKQNDETEYIFNIKEIV